MKTVCFHAFSKGAQLNIYTQAYRSGHNEAVLKTVRPKATGVRIPLPAPKRKERDLFRSFLFRIHAAMKNPSLAGIFDATAEFIESKSAFAFGSTEASVAGVRCKEKRRHRAGGAFFVSVKEISARPLP